MRVSTIGGVEIRPALPTTDVSFDGGGRPTSEVTAIDATILARRPAKPLSRKVQVQLSGTNGMRKTDADALLAVYAAGTPFTVVLQGYGFNGTFVGCVFDDEPKFPPIPGSQTWVQASFTLYIPQ